MPQRASVLQFTPPCRTHADSSAHSTVATDAALPASESPLCRAQRRANSTACPTALVQPMAVRDSSLRCLASRRKGAHSLSNSSCVAVAGMLAEQSQHAAEPAGAHAMATQGTRNANPPPLPTNLWHVKPGTKCVSDTLSPWRVEDSLSDSLTTRLPVRSAVCIHVAACQPRLYSITDRCHIVWLHRDPACTDSTPFSSSLPTLQHPLANLTAARA